MEAEDLANHLLRGVKICTSAHEAFANCSYVISLDEIKREEDEPMKDWLLRNEQFFSRMGNIINDKALSSCKVSNIHNIYITQSLPLKNMFLQYLSYYSNGCSIGMSVNLGFKAIVKKDEEVSNNLAPKSNMFFLLLNY